MSCSSEVATEVLKTPYGVFMLNVVLLLVGGDIWKVYIKLILIFIF